MDYSSDIGRARANCQSGEFVGIWNQRVLSSPDYACRVASTRKTNSGGCDNLDATVMTDSKRLELIVEAVAYCQRVHSLGMPAACYTKALREPVHFLWERRAGSKISSAQYRSPGR